MKKWLPLTLLCLLLAACGPGLVYPNLDWIIPKYVDDYISLDDRQADRLKACLSRQLDWHCRVQLPVYADLLQDVARDFSDPSHPVTPERLAEHLARIEACWLELRIQLAPDIAELLASATDAQLGELYDKLERKNRKLKRKYLEAPKDEVRRRWKKRMTKRLDYWLPDLTPAQEKALDEWSRSLIPLAADRIDDRKRVQAAFRNLLDRRRDRDRFRSGFTDLLTTYDRTRTPEYQAKRDANTAHTLAFLARLDRLLTADQRDHLLDRLGSLSRSFERLACAPAPQAPEPVAAARR